MRTALINNYEYSTLVVNSTVHKAVLYTFVQLF